jgi:hypothetical protein
MGKQVPENATLMLGAEEYRIEFSIGEKIELSLKQFIDILNACIFQSGYKRKAEEKDGLVATNIQ